MPGKRIIVTCDGTWVNSDSGFVRNSWLPWKTGGHLANPSNVTRLARALQPVDTKTDTQQITYYQNGLGSDGNWWSYYIGGYLGAGISENIREAYGFISNNYVRGDQIFLIGFSRGAFTARSILGLISAVGVLTKAGMANFYTIFEDWENQTNPKYRRNEDLVNSQKDGYEPLPNYQDDPAKYVAELVKRKWTLPNVEVEAVAVWDTVGTLGVPRFAPWPLSLLSRNERREYSFVDCEIPSNLKRAYQVLALDERRTPFSPSLWEMPENLAATALLDCRQTWMPGNHSGVGGGYDDSGTADIALAWIVARLEGLLAWDPDYLQQVRAANLRWLAENDPSTPRPWSCGKVYSSESGFMNWLTGSAPRTPGEYHRTDPKTGHVTPQLLRNTHEFVHPSVRVRRDLGGKGPRDQGSYVGLWPPQEWTVVAPGDDFEGQNIGGKEWSDRIKWVKKDSKGNVVWIAEEELGEDEWALVAKDSPAVKFIKED